MTYTWLEVRKKVITYLSTCLPLGSVVVVPFLTEHNGGILVLLALPISALTTYLMDVCGVKKNKIFNDWFSLLLRICLFTISVQALSMAIKTMSHGTGLDILEKVLKGSTLPIISTFIIILIALLFTLGLDRSSLLRQLITLSSISVVFLLIYYSISLEDNTLVDKNKHLFIQEEWTKIVFISGALISSFAGTGMVKGQIESIKKYSEVTITVLLLCLIMYSAVATCLCMLVTNSIITMTDVPLLKIFNVREMWRTEVVVYCLIVTALSLSLPESMSTCISSVVGLASHACIIPVLFARESIFTNTHLHAIILISCVSAVLNIFCVYQKLIYVASSIVLLNALVSNGYLIFEQYIHIYRSASVFTISGRIKNSAQYQTLSMNPVQNVSTENLVPQHDDADSGQGSDTDIDAAVEEFKDQVMVVSELPMNGRVNPPCNASSITENSYLKLLPVLGLLVCFIATGIFMLHKMHTLLSLVLFSEVCLTCLLLTQPIEYQIEGQHRSMPQWVPILTSTLSIILLSQLLVHVWYILCIWTIVGLFLYWRMKQKSSRQFKRRQRVRLESLPQQRVIASYLTAIDNSQDDSEEVIFAAR